MCMRDGRFWTFWELKEEIYNNWGGSYSENSVSAGIRDLRKTQYRTKYGLHPFYEVVEKKSVENLSGRGRHYKYRLTNIVRND